jgi:hypothetical protein
MDRTSASRVEFVVKRQAVDAAVDTDTGLRFTISTEAPDLAGDIVVQSGLTPAYQPLPAMVDHGVDMGDLIGTWRDIANQGQRTSARLELLPQGISRSADFVRALHKAGVRLAASVKFLPDETEPIVAKGAGSRVTGYRYLRSRLVEASVVPMPCNAEALQEVGKSLSPSYRDALDRLVLHERARNSATIAKAVATVKRIDLRLSPRGTP